MIQKKTYTTQKHFLLPDLSYNGKDALPPKLDDLNRLYELIVATRSLTVMEFGCGYSTFVIAQALKENRAWFLNLKEKPEVRNKNMFQCFSVDTNPHWIQECASKIKDENVSFSCSMCNAVILDNQVCHLYQDIPNIVPDFIYLDGPDPKQVVGYINGISFDCHERTPMSADILLMEPTLIPGTHILVDGRANNVRFLQNNFKRDWEVNTYEEHDQTVFYLDEPRLGKVNVVGRDICQ